MHAPISACAFSCRYCSISYSLSQLVRACQHNIYSNASPAVIQKVLMWDGTNTSRVDLRITLDTCSPICLSPAQKKPEAPKHFTTEKARVPG